ncbi:MAG: hypothetical protein ABIN01_23125 [Ferruginibacter sp.]
MNIDEKKKEVLALLSTTNDPALIEEVYDMLHIPETIDQVNVEQLPSPLREKINKALDDYKTGNYITHEEMKQKVHQWLIK